MKTAVAFLSTAVATTMGQGVVGSSECWVDMHGPAQQVASTSNGQLLTLGGGQVVNNMPGWIDPQLTGSRFLAFPESQMLNYAYIPQHAIEPASYMRIWCAKHSSIQKCDLFMNVYKCKDCGPDFNTDFFDYLMSNNWEPSQCGPRFISDAGEDEHKFMTFRKQVPSDHLEVINFDSEVKLAFLTMNSNGVDCSTFAPSKCETSGYQQCKLINGECVDNWCPKTFQGPCAPPCGGCHNCALKEPAFQ
eukprot:TRINITY_DN103_c0_g1_i2.p1 TRINITY_DN103_c0_g1~~TRINITY_DN103_c0_g1_i2.p1  ORF type:complete len:247 (+),score=65.12 TRINITY_DN103_c0_g1_i2:65-805(+)